MGKLVSLEEVNASVLPARVLVLLSKYAQAMHEHAGLIIKISSMNVFRHVHKTHTVTPHPAVQKIYRELLVEVATHVAAGTMHTNYERQQLEKNRAKAAKPKATAELLIPKKSFNRRLKTKGSHSLQID